MSNTLRLWLAVPILATGLAAAAPSADAQWHRGYGGYHRGYGGYRHHGVGGALIGGLAAGAVIGAIGAGIYANSAPPPPVVYAPPPVVYAAPPPGYGPPGYAQPGYAQPGYGPPGY